MPAISDLSVIISGVTSPLAKALKDAEKHVENFKQRSSFMSGIGKGAGIGLGFFGFDHIVKSIKKAASEVPALQEAFGKLEKVAGKLVLDLVQADKWVPELANGVEKLLSKENVGQAWQEWAEQVESVKMKFVQFESDENIRKRVDAMREEYNVQVQQANLQQSMLAYQEKQSKLAEETAKKYQTEVDAHISRLKAERDALDPEGVKRREEEKFKSTGDVFKDAEIGLLQMQIAELEKKKQAEEENKKLLEDEKKKREEIDSLMRSAADDLYKQQYGEMELLTRKFEMLGATNAEVKKYRDMLDEVSFLRQQEDFWKVADEEMEKELNAVSDQRANAAKFDEQRNRLAGAMSGQEAYSLIANSAAAGNETKPLVKEQVEVSKAQLTTQKLHQRNAVDILNELKRINNPVIASL